jgi:hypothetical protein
LAIGDQHRSEEISKEKQRSDNDRRCRCPFDLLPQVDLKTGGNAVPDLTRFRGIKLNA